MSKDEADGLETPYSKVKVYNDGTLTIADAAKVLGVSGVSIRNWIEKGLRVAFSGEGTKGIAARVLMKDILDFNASGRDAQRFESEDGEVYEIEYEKARRAHMLADLEEIRRDREKGRIVLIEDVIREVEAEYAMIRAGVLGLPSRLVVPLSGMTDTRQIYEYLKKEVESALSDLSNGHTIAAAAVRSVSDDDGTDSEAEELFGKEGGAL